MKKVGDLLSGSIGQSSVLRAARAQGFFCHWPEVVGEILAKKSVPDRFENGVLHVRVESQAWGQELRMMEETILQRMNDIAREPELFLSIRTSVRPSSRDLRS